MTTGQIWAYQHDSKTPLLPVRIIHPGHHYGDRVVIEPRHGGRWLKTVTRVKLPCQWHDVLAYADQTKREVANEERMRQHEIWDRINTYKEVAKEPQFTDQDIYVLDVIRDIEIQQPIAYNLTAAAAAVGFSKAFLRRLIDSGELPVRYGNTKPVILYDDLWKWAHSLPTEPQSPYRD